MFIIPIFKHQLCAHKQTENYNGQEPESLERAKYPAYKEFYSVCAYDETYQVGRHHQQNIEDGSNSADVSIPRF